MACFFKHVVLGWSGHVNIILGFVQQSEKEDTYRDFLI